MPFQVVQTIEKGGLRLTAVPDQWVRNGTLFWPKSKQEKLRRQEGCVPDHTWAVINCIVKRSGFCTFEEADAEIDAMSDKSDTENDNGPNPRLQTNRPSRNKNCVLPAKYYNKMAEELSENHEQSVLTPTVPQEIKAKPRDIISVPTENIVQWYQPNTSTSALLQEEIVAEESYFPRVDIVENQQFVTPLAASQPELATTEATVNINDENYILLNQDVQIQQLQEDIKTIKDDVKTILCNQNYMSQVQNNLVLKLSEFQTQFEGYIKLSSKSQPSQDSAVKPITSLNDFEDFEKLVSNATSKDELRKKLGLLCNKGPGKGTSNAYYVIDSIFDRKFLKECSWTGSGKGETLKICFKAFTKSINFFFDIIHESDETFTKAECDKFFKIILKNARQRSESNQRMSTSKHRTKRKKTDKNTLAISTSSVALESASDRSTPPNQPLASDQPLSPYQPLPPVQPPSEQHQREMLDAKKTNPINNPAANIELE